jgi:hypothetical protein
MSPAENFGDLAAYIVISILTFAIGLILGHLLTSEYYRRRFIQVAGECSNADSLTPLIGELERES